MSGRDSSERTVLLDASVCITMAEVGTFDLLPGIRGRLVVPATVDAEIRTDPTAEYVDAAESDGWLTVEDPPEGTIQAAKTHLSSSNESGVEPSGDVALLALAIEADDVVMVTDDKPLRNTSKALSIPVSGSLGVLIDAVGRDDIDAEAAIDTLYAMDAVGARLSASLIRRVKRRIEEAD